jgi:hypothetical protein
MSGMPSKTMVGLKRYGSAHKTKNISEDLEGHEGIDDPKALAVWIRRKSLGAVEFKQHQKSAAAKSKK